MPRTRAVPAVAVFLGVLAALPGSAQTPRPDPSPHLLMGNPSRATADKDRPDNDLLTKPYFALS